MTTLIPPLDHQRKNSGTHLMFIIVLLFILWYFDTAVTASFVIKGFEWPHSWIKQKMTQLMFPLQRKPSNSQHCIKQSHCNNFK